VPPRRPPVRRWADEVAGRPLVVLTALYAAGIAAGGATAISTVWLMIMLGAALLAMVVLTSRLGQWLPVAGLGALVLGTFTYSVARRPASDDLARRLGQGVWVDGVIIEDQAFPEGVRYLRVVTTQARIGTDWEPARGTVQVRTALPFPGGVGDRVQVWGRLDVPPEAGNPGQASLRRRLTLRGIDAVVRVSVPDALRVVSKTGGASLIAWRAALQGRLIVNLTRVFPQPYPEQTAQLTAGLVFGAQASPVPDALAQLFRNTGLLHLLVASGQQVTLLLGFVFGVGHLLTRRRTGAWAAVWLLLGLGVVGWYAMLTAGGASIIRAVVIGGVAAGGAWLQRTRAGTGALLEIDRLTLLALAGLVVLLIDPAALFRPGPQLSFAAVAGLILVAPPVAAALGFLPRPVALWLAAPLAAELAITPLLATHFRVVPVAGALANLVAVPLVVLILPLGLITALTASVLPGVAHALALGCAVLVHWVIASARVGAVLPLARVWTPGWTFAHTVAFYVALAGCAWGCTRVARWLTAVQPVATLARDTATNVVQTTT